MGQRPYELEWANRTQDDHPPLVDFEDLTGWRVECKDAEAKFERTREQQIWGTFVGKLTYRAAGKEPSVRVAPPAPVKIEKPFDAVTCWIYGNNWGWTTDPETPQVAVTALFADAAGQEFTVPLAHVNWTEWFLCHRRLQPDQIKRVAGGAAFKGFVIANGRNTKDRALYFDNLAVFLEEFKPLTFQPRPERGIPMLPGQGVGTNTGPGKLPFPTRPETILPDNLTEKFKTAVAADGAAFVFRYDGEDGRLSYRLEPKTGTLSDLSAQWEGRGGVVRPCVGGGVCLQTPRGPVPPETAEHLGTAQKGDAVESRWRLKAGDVSAEATYTYRLWKKSLVVDVVALGGNVAEVRYGRALGLENPRLVTLPFYLYGSTRPAIAVSGPPDRPLFLAGHTDWCLTNSSEPWAANLIGADGVAFNGGTRYIPKTDGKRNDCFERLFITLSPRFEEVLPTIPNPVSPWKHITGTRVWRAHGASPNRAHDVSFWTECHRYGMTQVIVTDHETMWRDGGESFTFRTRAAPKKGGDEGEREYSRFMQDKLGFVYGPYNNFTDFAPVNEYWTPDLISRAPDNQLQQAWMRCYAPKPARAVEFCALLAPKIQEKFKFSTAYCDVHTAVAPWHRTDYDARVPGAGTCAAVFYSFGEIMLHQKAAWNGPVYSEGNNHFPYCGLTDGNYGQDQNYRPAVQPWLVDFDLRKLHDLCCNFGMGNPEMFFAGQKTHEPLDRFFAATVAFGHPGFLTYEGGLPTALRSYFLLQPLHARYALSSAKEIRYVDADGKLLDTTAAVATGVYARSQVVTRYADGTITAANGHPQERLVVEAYGRKLDLPPNGYAGWTEDGAVNVFSGDVGGHRCDYAVAPAQLFVDGRGRFVRFEKAAGNGIGIYRLSPGGCEITPFQGAECGFAIREGTAVALDKEGKVIGPAKLRVSRGLTYVEPVANAFSYRLSDETIAAVVELTCARDEVVPGETVIVRGKEEHTLQVPADAKPGARLWREFEGGWIDFTVMPLADAAWALDGNSLRLTLASHLARAGDFVLLLAGQEQTLRLEPGKPSAAAFDLGAPAAENEEVLALTLRAGGPQVRLERGLKTELGTRRLAALPEKWRAGMRLRKQDERFDFGETRASVDPRASACGGVERSGIFMHPPWMGGTGYSFALYDAVSLPAQPAAAFRALVGKGDGSDLGDGILYKVAVVDANGTETMVAEQTVARHEWLPIEADLTPWAGKPVQLKLLTDVGPKDDSSGDWGCWAEMRIESRQPGLFRTLDENVEAYRREAAPFPVAGVTVEQLRSARRGWLRYDGMGLEGGVGDYASFAVLNGVELGGMAGAGGDAVKGVWAEKVGVPLTPVALKTLGFFNRFALRNPKQDCFKVRRFWIELELADGRKCSSLITPAVFTQPPGWKYAEGIKVPPGEDIRVGISFRSSAATDDRR
ncbi:MAG: hypothetical protein NTW87_30835 [Planctomycetota bacterium]|nr:hypothetical protein [Planctomycetota bacterium]